MVTGDGKVQLNRNVVNGSEPMLRLIGGLPAGTPVASGAAYGWGWLVELLEDHGFAPHLVHPLRCKAIASARLKNDKVDAAILAQLRRAGLLPGAWIAPPQVRQLRAQLRHRASLVRLGTQPRNRIHAVAADHGYDRAGSYWTGPGRGWLAELDLPPVSREIVTGCLASIDALAPVTGRPGRELHQRSKAGPRVTVLTAQTVLELMARGLPDEVIAHRAGGQRHHCPASHRGHHETARRHQQVRSRCRRTPARLDRVDPVGREDCHIWAAAMFSYRSSSRQIRRSAARALRLPWGIGKSRMRDRARACWSRGSRCGGAW